MDQRIQFIISTIEKDPATRLNSNDLALPINLSSSRLRHLFKAETGQTVGQYRKDARLEKARVLLRTTLLSVKELCITWGSVATVISRATLRRSVDYRQLNTGLAAKNLLRFGSLF
ncbi:MAG TPA: helix-turn-helix domain-containing protein [Pyrinomonadaceae bacterium]|nr:helix-turn-helix domain-containing protein [Pyrinomonadaceae bacterium]